MRSAIFSNEGKYNPHSCHNTHSYIFKIYLQICLHKHDLQTESSLLYRLIRHLLQIVRETPQNNSINMEALKCLGEIGPLNLAQMSYYFEADNLDNGVCIKIVIKKI